MSVWSAYPSPPPAYPSPPFSSSTSPNVFEDRLQLTTPTTPPTPRTPNSKLNPAAPPPLPGKRPYTERIDRKQPKAKKPKAARKLNFEESDFNKSPVHGTIIRDTLPVPNHRSEDGTKTSNELTFGSDTNKDKPKLSGGEYVCKLCTEQYTDPLSLAQHKCSRIVHEVYRCPECDKVFNCPANLASHRRWHKPRPNKSASPTNPRVIAAATPTSKDSAAKLYEQATNPDYSQLSDQSSDVTSVISTSSLSGSESSRSTPSPGSQQSRNNEGHYYNCNQCSKKFRRPANLRKHMQTHGENNTHPCQYCGQVFSSLTSRAKHMMTHHHTMTTPTPNIQQEVTGSQLSPRYDASCHICGGIFENQDALERHSRLHNVSEVYPCKFCSSMFPSSSGLTRHINKEHTSENRQVLMLNHQMPTSITV